MVGGGACKRSDRAGVASDGVQTWRGGRMEIHIATINDLVGLNSWFPKETACNYRFGFSVAICHSLPLEFILFRMSVLGIIKCVAD